jgi:DNA-binding HxlR family transcriptional regulator
MEDIEKIISEVAAKDAKVLCREVLSITDTMDVLRSKWTVEILTAILCGNTRFKDILTAIHGMSDKVLTERLRQMVDDRLIERHECRGYPTAGLRAFMERH